MSITRQEMSKRLKITLSGVGYYLQKLQIKPTGFIQNGKGNALTYPDEVLEKIKSTINAGRG